MLVLNKNSDCKQPHKTQKNAQIGRFCLRWASSSQMLRVC